MKEADLLQKNFGIIPKMKEADLLQKNFGIIPKIYMHIDCPVTTPFDKLANITNWETIYHGTCGVGVGATFQREEDFHSIHVGDLQYMEVLELKLAGLVTYYNTGVPDLIEFLDAIHRMLPLIQIVTEMPYFREQIFEGAQGLLLDQNIGFFPHVTRSNTGSKNILELLNGTELHYYLITRCYQTRHGHGPITNKEIPLRIKPNPKETNKYNAHQGHFRTSVLDLSLLKYGMERDKGIRKSSNKTLVVTCCDQIEGSYQFTIAGKLCTGTQARFERILSEYLNVQKVLFINDPTGARISI